MNRNLKAPKVFLDLMEFWAKHCHLEDYHLQWAMESFEILNLKRGEYLFHEGSNLKITGLVVNGLLAREKEGSWKGRRRLVLIAGQYQSISTTIHPYSTTCIMGDIVALRKSLILVIGNKKIRQGLEQDPNTACLVNILSNNNSRALAKMLTVKESTSPSERYLLFDRLFPELRKLTTQREQADLLGISRDTVQKMQRFLLFNGQNR